LEVEAMIKPGTRAGVAAGDVPSRLLAVPRRRRLLLLHGWRKAGATGRAA